MVLIGCFVDLVCYDLNVRPESGQSQHCEFWKTFSVGEVRVLIYVYMFDKYN